MPWPISAGARSLGTGKSAVRAEPPKAPRSTSTTRWEAAPRAAATRRAASSSTTCRWPYRKLSAWAWNPSETAMASTVAESIPPERRTTAGRGAVDIAASVAAKQVPECAPEVGVAEDETGLRRARRDHALAREQQRVGHLAEGEPEGHGGRGEDRRAPEHLAQGLGEDPIGDRARRNRIEGADEGGRGEGVQDEPQRVVQAHPAHPLPSVAEPGTGPELERREHPCQPAAGRRQDHAEPRVDHADAGLRRRTGGRLPCDAGFRQEVGPRRTGLGERLVTATAVDADP